MIVCNRVIAKKVLVDERSSKFVFPITLKEILIPEKILAILESDFNEGSKKGKSYSVQDERFLRILEANITKTPNGHYEMPLPLKSDNINFPNTRALAEKRLWQLSRIFKSNKIFKAIIRSLWQMFLMTVQKKFQKMN